MSEARVLVVDDDRLLLELTAMMLEPEYSVLRASSAAEAWDLFMRRGADCIVSDVVMPGRTGIDLLTSLREAGHDVPVIVMTGQSSEEYAVECANLKTSGYLRKPLERDSLLQTVKRALKKQGAPSSPEKEFHVKLIEVRGWIKKHLAARLSVGEAAKGVGVSVSHLCRLYKNELGISFTDDVNRMRVERAKALLGTTAMTIGEVAAAAGYENSQHFYKNFKKLTGLTPRKYRVSSG